MARNWVVLLCEFINCSCTFKCFPLQLKSFSFNNSSVPLRTSRLIPDKLFQLPQSHAVSVTKYFISYFPSILPGPSRIKYSEKDFVKIFTIELSSALSGALASRGRQRISLNKFAALFIRPFVCEYFISKFLDSKIQLPDRKKPRKIFSLAGFCVFSAQICMTRASE